MMKFRKRDLFQELQEAVGEFSEYDRAMEAFGEVRRELRNAFRALART